MAKPLAKKYTLRLEVSYNFTGKLLKEYLEWLDDYKDTPKMRKAFAVDRFVPENWKEVIDNKAKLIVEEK